MDTIVKYMLPMAMGVTVHLALFIHGEWHLYAPSIVIAHTSMTALFTALILFGSGSGVKHALAITVQTLLCYLLALFTSIGVYRVFFHRLRKFPGPLLARITKIWHMVHCLDSRNHLVLEKVYKKYGPIVRTGEKTPGGNTSCAEALLIVCLVLGPNEITVFHPDIHQATDGHGSNCTKSGWYDMVSYALSNDPFIISLKTSGFGWLTR